MLRPRPGVVRAASEPTDLSRLLAGAGATRQATAPSVTRQSIPEVTAQVAPPVKPELQGDQHPQASEVGSSELAVCHNYPARNRALLRPE